MTALRFRVERGSPTGGAGTGAQEYTANVFVDCDDCKDTGATVLAFLISEGFDYGTVWKFGNDQNSKARLFQIDPPQYIPSTEFTWRVTLRYRELRLLVGAGSASTASPEDFEPQITARTAGRSEPAERGIYRGGLATNWSVDEERAVTNSAGSAFVPAIEVTRWNKVIRVRRRTAGVTFSDDFFPDFWINDREFTLFNSFKTIPIKQYELRFSGWEIDQEEYLGYDVVRVEFVGEIKKGGWRSELLDQGTMGSGCGRRDDGRGGEYYDFDQAKMVAPNHNILDRHGLPVTEPVLLDGDGNANPPCADPLYGEWSFYDEIDPTSLGFFAGITRVPTPEDD